LDFYLNKDLILRQSWQTVTDFLGNSLLNYVCLFILWRNNLLILDLSGRLWKGEIYFILSDKCFRQIFNWFRCFNPELYVYFISFWTFYLLSNNKRGNLLSVNKTCGKPRFLSYARTRRLNMTGTKYMEELVKYLLTSTRCS
jgi:hypothetical protein